MMPLRLAWVSLFSIAMGCLEAVVVIYIRIIYYPEGFGFPLKAMEPWVGKTEALREIATVIMLAAVGVLAGKSKAARLGWFLYAFAVWDIFYYVFLWLVTGWPPSLLTWDILFLLPLPWVGPVITPLIMASLMIAASRLMIKFDRLPGRVDWTLGTAGAGAVILSWVMDYSRYVKSVSREASVWIFGMDEAVFEGALSYIPVQFDWAVFSAGAALTAGALFIFGRRCYSGQLPQ